MISNQPTLQLGVEELCMALSLLGRPEVAKGLLFLSSGRLSPDEERGRLLAAGHSLMARQLLSVQQGQSSLSDAFRSLLYVMVDNDFAIHYMRKSTKGEQVVAYFVRGSEVLEQKVEQGVVYHLSLMPNRQSILTRGLSFFGLQEQAADYEEALVPFDVLNQARQRTPAVAEEIKTFFRSAGVPDPQGQLIAEDLASSTWRGAVTRMKISEGQLLPTGEMLLLKGRERVWLFPITVQDDQPFARIVSASKESFLREVQALIA